MGLFFKIFPNLSQNLLKIKKILGKSGDFAQNLDQNWADRYMKGPLFSWKLIFVWVFFQILRQHISTQTKLESPPQDRTRGERMMDTSSIHIWYCNYLTQVNSFEGHFMKLDVNWCHFTCQALSVVKRCSEVVRTLVEKCIMKHFCCKKVKLQARLKKCLVHSNVYSR